MKTLPTEALAVQFNASQKGVFLVELDADAPETGVTTLYDASRQFVLSGQTYTDALLGIDFGWQKIRKRGGHAAVAQATVRYANLEKLSQLTDTYYLENDELRLYWVPVTGSEATSDKVLLQRGVVENYPIEMRDWELSVVDASDKDFRDFPAKIISLASHVDAPEDSMGEPLPFVFGDLNVGPVDGAGKAPKMAKARCLDRFGQTYQSAVNAHTCGDVYQYYSQSKRSALIASGDITQTGDTFTVDAPTRLVEIRPARPKSTNNVGWKLAANGINTAGVTLVAGNKLHVNFGGMIKAGTVTAATVEILANGGSYVWRVYHGTTLLDNGTDSGDKTVDLAADIATYWTGDWDFENLSIEIDYSASAEIEELWFEMTFSDQMSGERAPLDLHQKLSGYKDDTTRYNSTGASNPNIIDGSSMLEKPADILEAILRDVDLMNLSVDNIDLASFDDARSDMGAMKFAFQMYRVLEIQFIDELCFQAGMHLYKSHEGKWRVVFQDKTRVATSTFLHEWNIAATGSSENAAELEYEFRIDRTPTREVLNELVLRYGLDRQSGVTGSLKAYSGRYRVKGTATSAITVSGSTITLTDSAADFVNDGVLVGETVYVDADGEYVVATVAATIITATSTATANESDVGTVYWIGPNLDGRMRRSQNRYKSDTSLGLPFNTFTAKGGYETELINDDDTLELVADRLIEWSATRRLRAELTTGLNAIDVQLGDAAYLDQPWVPQSRRPVGLTTTDGATASGDNSIDVQTGWGAAFRALDRLLLDWEVLKVLSIAGDTLTVSRAQAGTVAAAHVDATSVKLLMHKWEVTGILPHGPDPGQSPGFELELQEMPRSYTRVGIAVADGYPAGTAATVVQLLSAGWATYNVGLLFKNVEGSDYSYAGA